MKTLKLNLEVKNGETIVGIVYKLFKVDTEEAIVKGSKEGSFSIKFNNLDGKYNLYIIGSNPLSENGRTTIKLEGEGITFSKGSTPNPTTKTGKSYYAKYSFETN